MRPRKTESSDGGGASLLKQDVPASFVVFLVALPLCMGIALASGMPAEAGLITGVIGGLVVGTLSGSPLQVSGPAAGLIVLVHDIVHEQGASALALVLLLAGAIQLAVGLARQAQWFRIVSPAVIQGMLAGIGAVILLGQLHALLGGRPQANGLKNLLALPQALYDTFVPQSDFSRLYAAFLGLMTITAIVVWNEHFKKRTPIPGSLVGVLAGCSVAGLLGLNIAYVEAPSHVTDFVRPFDVETLNMLVQPSIWLHAGAVALIASAESLLSAGAVDQLHRGPRTRFDRELAAQGVGNLLSGLVGGLPMTGVIVRSKANIDAGGRTRLSAILHGAWLLAFVALAPGLLGYIPIASLAGILVLTGYKLLQVQPIRDLRKFGKGEVVIYAATFLGIIVEDLLTGVILGMVLTGAKLLVNLSRLRVRLEASTANTDTFLHLEGSATFLRLPHLAAALEAVTPQSRLHLCFDKLEFIDHTCLDLLMNWASRHECAGGKVIVDWGSLHACFRRHPPAILRQPFPLRRAS